MAEMSRDILNRRVSETDLELICDHRQRMFVEAGRSEHAVLAMMINYRPWLKARLADGRYFGFVLSDGGAAVAAVGLMEIDWPPHPAHPEQDKRAYVMNLYIEPAYRKRGLAKCLMELSEQEFARRGLQLGILHATSAARPLYESLGWSATNEMSKALKT